MIYKAEKTDLHAAASLAVLLWEGHTVEELEEELGKAIGDDDGAVFVLDIEEEAAGFAQCRLRHDYVEGTESSPVGYLEGIFIRQEYRKQGHAQDLLEECEKWAMEKGCSEFASDCELTNEMSLEFHLKAGFREANRIICFTKKLQEKNAVLRKVYFDKTNPANNCTSVFIKGAEVIMAGTTVSSMSVKEKCEIYQKYADEYGIHFIFDDDIPQINFYAVPQIDVFATDGEGGFFGTIGRETDFEDVEPIGYIDKERNCYLIAENGNVFLTTVDAWREHLVPCEGIVLYRSREEAEKQLEFAGPEHGE